MVATLCKVKKLDRFRTQCGVQRDDRDDGIYSFLTVERREVVTHLVEVTGVPVQRACRAAGIGRATYYRPLVDWAQRDAPVIEALLAWPGTYSVARIGSAPGRASGGEDVWWCPFGGSNRALNSRRYARSVV